MADAPGTITLNGTLYMHDAKGGLTPASIVKPEHLLMDELVRSIADEAEALRAQVAAFRGSSLARIDDYVALILAEYQVSIGGAKGNVTLHRYDGLRKILVQVPDILDFGPELQAAKALIDELLREWAADSPDDLKTIVTEAFKVDKKGQINRNALFGLLRHNITDERWKKAMQALRDSITIIGSKRYMRVYTRPNTEAEWIAIPIDLASS